MISLNGLAAEEVDGEPQEIAAAAPDLAGEFALAAFEINAEFHRRVSNLRGRMPRSQIDAAIKIAVEWRAGALEALKSDIAAKQNAIKSWRKAKAIARRQPHRKPIVRHFHLSHVDPL